MQQKKVIWMLLVGCAAVAIFYPLVFQYEKDAALHAQSNTSSAQTGANQSLHFAPLLNVAGVIVKLCTRNIAVHA